MKRVFIFCFCLFAFDVVSQNHQYLDTVRPPSDYDNIYSRHLYSDSLASSFLIFVKREVKLHKHVAHIEHVYILEGEGEMQVGLNRTNVKKGDIIFIPKNTPHSLKVTSVTPLKVLSVQSPFFDGKDRVMLDASAPK